MLVEYTTVAGPGEAVLIEKKSKFIAQVRPVTSAEEAEAFVEAVRRNTGTPPTMCQLTSLGLTRTSRSSAMMGNRAALLVCPFWKS